MKKVKILKVFLIIFFLFLFIGIGMLIGLKFKAFETKEVIATSKQIAVVNMDMGVDYSGQYINYGKEISKTFNENYILVNLETAKQGLLNGQYNAYITFTGDFSKNIVSINQTPTKTEMYYQLSPILTAEQEVEITKEILLLQQQINDRVSYLYINSILDEYSIAKNQAKNVMTNDKKDYDAIMQIKDFDLITLINLTEVERLGIDIENLDMSKSFEENVQIANQFNQKYVEVMGLTSEQLNALKTDETLSNAQNQINDSVTNTIGILNYESIKPNDPSIPIDPANIGEVLEKIESAIDNINKILEENTEVNNINTSLNSINISLNSINISLNSINTSLTNMNIEFLNNIYPQNAKILLEYKILIEYFKMTYNDYKDNEILKNQLSQTFKDENFFELELSGIETSEQYINQMFSDDNFINERESYYDIYNNELEENMKLSLKSISSIKENIPKLTGEISKISPYAQNIQTQNSSIGEKIYANEDSVKSNITNLQGDITNLIEITQSRETAITNLNQIIESRDKQIVFYKNKKNPIIEAINPLINGEKNTFENIEIYKDKINAYNPLLPYEDSQKDFEKLYKQYVNNNKEIENTYNEDNSKNVDFVRETYKYCDEHIKQLKQDISLYDEESKNKLSQVLQDLKNVKQQTSQSNINMMNDFSNRLPYIDVNTLKNQEIQTFIATPLKITENATEKILQEKDNTLENMLLLSIAILIIICTILLIVKLVINKKIKNQYNVSLED